MPTSSHGSTASKHNQMSSTYLVSSKHHRGGWEEERVTNKTATSNLDCLLFRPARRPKSRLLFLMYIFGGSQVPQKAS